MKFEKFQTIPPTATWHRTETSGNLLRSSVCFLQTSGRCVGLRAYATFSPAHAITILTSWKQPQLLWLMQRGISTSRIRVPPERTLPKDHEGSESVRISKVFTDQHMSCHSAARCNRNNTCLAGYKQFGKAFIPRYSITAGDRCKYLVDIIPGYGITIA